MRHLVGVLRCVGAVGMLIGFTFACGNDTAADPKDGDDSGGSGGTGGTKAGSGGTSSADGGSGGTSANTSTSTTASSAGGVSGVTSSTASSTTTTGAAGAPPEDIPGLFEPCEADDDCESDLICIAADSSSLLVGGPAHGVCTTPCDADTTCGASSACILFSEDGEAGYCLPVCGVADGNLDCLGRPDAVCDVLPVGVSCTSDLDCGGVTICVGGECQLPVCLPKCRSDSDCPDDRFCDPSLGECVDDEPSGLGINEICDPDAATDECNGFCAAGDGDEPGRCFQTCTLGVYPACGSESLDDGTAECLIPYIEGADPGDLGFCVQLCDCNSDCPDEGIDCISFASERIAFDPPIVRGRAGFCATGADDTVEVLTCD